MSRPFVIGSQGVVPEGAPDVLFQVQSTELTRTANRSAKTPPGNPHPSALLGVARPSVVRFEPNDAKQNSKIEIPRRCHW
jgi:hypothetical protein